MGVRASIPDKLSDGGVAIRRLRRADAQEIVEAVRESAGELPVWMPDLTPDLTVEAIGGWIDAAEGWWEDGTGYNFAIVADAGAESLLGGCGLSNINHRHRLANLFYWVRSSCTGRGTATAATKLLARFGFEQLGLQRVEIVVAVGNLASARVAEKAGARHEGVLRNRLHMRDRPYDANMYSLIPSDCGL